MVARLNAGALMRTICLTAILFLCALRATATVEEARQQLATYKTVLTEMQEALNRQDGAAYEALRDRSMAALADARKAFEAADAGSSTDPAVVFSYAEVVKLEGDDDLGAEIARAALDKGVESPALWRIYGEMCLATGPSQYAVGMEALQKSTALDGTSPESADAWFALGRYYLEREMPDPASNAFASALAANPAHVPAQLGDAAARIYAGDIAGAGAIVERVGRAAQPHDVLLRSMVRAALFDYDVTRREFDDTAEDHYAFSRLMYIAGRFPEAVLAANRAGHLAPERVDILNFQSAIQIQLGDYAGAIQSCEASLRAKADQPQIQQTLEQLKQAAQEAAQQQQAPQTGQGKGMLR